MQKLFKGCSPSESPFPRELPLLPQSRYHIPLTNDSIYLYAHKQILIWHRFQLARSSGPNST